MGKVKVWNDNVHPYREKFKGDEIKIAAKSFIVMEEDEAHQFRGSFSPPVLNVDGVHLPEGFKMIRVEKLAGGEDVDPPKAETHRCIACAYVGDNAADVAEHTKTHAHNAVVDEEAEKALVEKRGPGRPKKAS